MELKPLCKRVYEREHAFYRFKRALATVILAIGGGLFITGLGTGMFAPNEQLSPDDALTVSLFLVLGAIFMLIYLVMATFIKEPYDDIRSTNCCCQLCRSSRNRRISDSDVH